MTTTAYEYTSTLTIVECCECHMDFGMTPRFVADRRADHGWWYCPQGHRQHWPEKSDKERLREQVEQRDRELARTRARLDQSEARAEHEANRARALKGVVTKTKRRIGKGVCPCCNRHFPNVEAHMATEHPDFSEAP
jgi:hypothetical protein